MTTRLYHSVKIPYNSGDWARVSVFLIQNYDHQA